MMTEYRLGQTLVVAPETSFAQIAAVLEGIGWRRDDSGPAAPPLVAGEPELAIWTWHGRKPFVVYTFNPVARMRILDVATTPPSFRGMIAAQLPLLVAEQVSSFLSSATPREKLLGLWAAQETERLDLISGATRLLADPEPVVAEQARSVVSRLEQIAQARIEALANLRLLADAAETLVEQLGHAKFVQGLCPTPEDCANLFDEELAEAVAARAAHLYERPPIAAPGELYPTLEVTVAPAGLLRFPNELSDRFPRGYRNIAGWMTPNRVWLTWAFKSAEAGAVRYDGLAWLDDHWIWLPKPFRIVAPLVLPKQENGSPTIH